MESIKEVADGCLKRWGQDIRTRDLHAKAELWLSKVDEQDKYIFLRLLDKFQYYSLEHICEALSCLFSEYKKQESTYTDSLYLPLINEKGVHNHSYDIRSLFQTVSCIDKICFPTEMQIVVSEYPLDMIKNIVLIDDMTGSGRTITDSIKFMKKNFSSIFIDKKVYLIIIEACDSGLEKIYELENECGLKVIPIWYNLHKKALGDDYIFSNEEVEKIREIIIAYESKITNNNKDYILGYDKSEALMAFYYDTPNNTLSSFWFNNKQIGWSALFPRKQSTCPAWGRDLKRKRKSKGTLLYNMAKEKGSK